MELDTERWSGDGAFTQLLIAALREIAEVAMVRVEDAPSAREDTGYNFIANDVFVGFQTAAVSERRRLFGLLPYTRKREVSAMDLAGLGSALSLKAGIGEPDYADDGMIQYLRTERIVAPYQTRGIKVVELVRIYRRPASPP